MLQRTLGLDLHQCCLINHHRSPVQPLTSTRVSLNSYHHKKNFPSIYGFPRSRRLYVLSLSLSLSLSIYIYIYIYIYGPLSLPSPHSSGSFRLGKSLLQILSSFYLKICSTSFSFPALGTEITSGLHYYEYNSEFSVIALFSLCKKTSLTLLSSR